MNHDGDFTEQLQSGFRVFDLRVCFLPDCTTPASPEPNAFRWWHGVSGEPILDGLRAISAFAAEHPKEVVVLRFSHLQQPGDDSALTLDMPPQVLKTLGDLIHSTLRDNLAPATLFRGTTTLEEIWKSGKNVFVFIEDTLYNRLGHAEYFVYNWADTRVVGARFRKLSNPQGALRYRAAVITAQRHKNDVSEMTYNPFVVTHQSKTLVAAVLGAYGWVCWFAVPFLLFLDGIALVLSVLFFTALLFCPLRKWTFGFEGHESSLLEMARRANQSGVSRLRRLFPRRDAAGAKTQIFRQGFNCALRAWSRRRDACRLNIVTIDHFRSSELVDIAIECVQGSSAE